MPAAPLTTVTVTSDAYTANPSVTLLFDADDVTVWNESTDIADIAYVSFDGVNDHWKLVPTTSTAAISMKLRHTKLWFRLETAPGPVDLTYMGGAR